MAGIGSQITALDYNTIQDKIAGVLGTGSGQSGYGQPVASSNVVAGDLIRLTNWVNLRTDLVKARQHQTGTTVGSTTALDGLNLQVPLNTLVVTEALRNQYNLFADTVVSNKFTVGSGQFSPETLLVSTRTSGWNGTLSNEVTVQFSSANHTRSFFNAGGQVLITSSRTGGAETGTDKDPTWSIMLNQSGTIAFSAISTTSNGSSPGELLSGGYFSLTTSNQVIYHKAPLSGSYTVNDYYIYARVSSGGDQVIFTMTYQDDAGPNPNYDETVTGTLTNTIQMNRPSGDNVSVTAPTATRAGNMIP